MFVFEKKPDGIKAKESDASTLINIAVKEKVKDFLESDDDTN